MLNLLHILIPSEWQNILKDHISFFTCQTICVIVEVIFVCLRNLVLRVSNWVLGLISPGGIDEVITSIILHFIAVVSLIPILLFAFVHASSIVKWTIDRPDMKWLLPVIRAFTLSRQNGKSSEIDI